jgi:hypothetical protein
MIFTSLEEVYKHADTIHIAIDRERKTWSGNDIEIPQSFFDRLKDYDTLNKITLYFDTFYVPSLTPMECETRERNLLLKQMGKGGWFIQLDVDEYIYDFQSVVTFLKKNKWLTWFPKLTPFSIKGTLITLYKELPEGYLFIDNGEKFSFITNIPHYDVARYNHSIRIHDANISVIHQSWAREEKEIKRKIENWGHRDDFDTSQFFEFWKSIQMKGYEKIQNFHPFDKVTWNKLHFIESRSIQEFIEKYATKNPQKIHDIPVKKTLKIMLKNILRR